MQDAQADGDRPLLTADPPLYADDFAPALWVPVTRAVRARRRLYTLGERLPAEQWDAPSAAPGWSRRDQLAHLATSDRRYHDALIAALNGAPLAEWSPHPDQPGPQLDLVNRQALSALAEESVAQLTQRLRDGATKTAQLLSALDEAQLLNAMGFRPNALSLTEAWADHDNAHADQIINGPTMMRTL